MKTRHTLHRSNVIRVRQVSLNSHLDIREFREVDRREDVVRDALFKQNCRVRGVVGQSSVECGRVVGSVGVRDFIDGPGARSPSRDHQRQNKAREHFVGRSKGRPFLLCMMPRTLYDGSRYRELFQAYSSEHKPFRRRS
jgi:hypothetical protein